MPSSHTVLWPSKAAEKVLRIVTLQSAIATPLSRIYVPSAQLVQFSVFAGIAADLC